MAEEHPPDWPKIVERHMERVFRIAYYILGSVHDAEVVSQLAFIESKSVQEAGPIQSWSGLFARLALTRTRGARRCAAHSCLGVRVKTPNAQSEASSTEGGCNDRKQFTSEDRFTADLILTVRNE